MSKVLLSTRAYSNLISLSPRERHYIRKVLAQLKENPEAGLRLWGREGLYLYETPTDTKIVYKLTGNQIHVVGIKAAIEYLLPSRAKITAIVLAAGNTSYDDTLPISRVTDTFLAANVDDIIVVLGHQAERVKKDLQNRDVKIIVNPDYEKGLSKSLRCGLRMVSGDIAAVVLTLGNLPFIRPEVIDRLIRIYRKEKAPIIVPTFSRMRGHPVIFDTFLIPELLRARGNIGGREVLRHHSRELIQVEVEDAGILTKKDR
jgi:molybdenum cofactor cytidylyltransferase